MLKQINVIPDFSFDSVNTVISLSQYDASYVINFDLSHFEGVSSVAYARLDGLKADGKGFSANLTLSDNVAVLTGNDQLTAAAGRGTYELVLLDAEKTRIGSHNLYVDVEAAPLADDSFISNTEIPSLIDLGRQNAADAKTAETSAEQAAALAKSSADEAKAAAAQASKSVEDAQALDDDLKKNITAATTINAQLREAIANTPANVGVDTIYPVGSIYMSMAVTDPSSVWPGTTWERIQDMFLLAAGNTYAAGATGGEATHKLTEEEMPSHTHYERFRGEWQVEPVYARNINAFAHASYDWIEESDQVTHTPCSDYVGGDQAHNNLPPYIAVYMWKRTA